MTNASDIIIPEASITDKFYFATWNPASAEAGAT